MDERSLIQPNDDLTDDTFLLDAETDPDFHALMNDIEDEFDLDDEDEDEDEWPEDEFDGFPEDEDDEDDDVFNHLSAGKRSFTEYDEFD